MASKPTGNPNGRPRKFKSVEELQIKMDAYFEEASKRKKNIYDKDGKKKTIIDPAPVHVTGLCVHLDIDLNTLMEYQKLPEFSSSVTRAKQKCEAYAVNCCYEGKKGNKADFVLRNNFNWKDKFEHSVDDGTKTLLAVALGKLDKKE